MRVSFSLRIIQSRKFYFAFYGVAFKIYKRNWPGVARAMFGFGLELVPGITTRERLRDSQFETSP